MTGRGLAYEMKSGRGQLQLKGKDRKKMLKSNVQKNKSCSEDKQAKQGGFWS
jgi:hypothetical protein